MDTISTYFQLVQERPELFEQSALIPLILDENEMRAFSDTSGKTMGLVYDNSPFYLVLADLCSGKNGLYSYGRVVYCNPKSSGCVAVPRCGGKFGLLRIFRHAARQWSLEFPRGFAEDRFLTAEENVRKELAEEIGLSEGDCEVTYLGDVMADSGLSNGNAQIFLAEILPTADISLSEEEGIAGFQWIGEEQFRQMIREGEITDGFTLSAYARLLSAGV